MLRNWWPFALLLLAPLGLLPLGCSGAPDPWARETAPIRVVTTIPPLASFVRAVGGERVAVRCLCTATGAHDYTADYRDSQLMYTATVAFSVGLQLDEAFIDALGRLARRSDVDHVKLAEAVRKKGLLAKMRAHQHEDGKECDRCKGEYDPHVWLGVEESIVMVEAIRDALSERDPEHADAYRANAAAYVARLRKLQDEGRAMLADKKAKRIIGFHDAFGYFARSFGVTVAEAIEMSPGSSPSAYHLTRLEELCVTDPVGAITVEPRNPNVTSARRLQEALKRRNVHVPLVPLDPLETADAAELEREGASWYEARMRKNLEALAGALK